MKKHIFKTLCLLVLSQVAISCGGDSNKDDLGLEYIFKDPTEEAGPASSCTELTEQACRDKFPDLFNVDPVDNECPPAPGLTEETCGLCVNQFPGLCDGTKPACEPVACTPVDCTPVDCTPVPDLDPTKETCDNLFPPIGCGDPTKDQCDNLFPPIGCGDPTEDQCNTLYPREICPPKVTCNPPTKDDCNTLYPPDPPVPDDDTCSAPDQKCDAATLALKQNLLKLHPKASKDMIFFLSFKNLKVMLDTAAIRVTDIMSLIYSLANSAIAASPFGAIPATFDMASAQMAVSVGGVSSQPVITGSYQMPPLDDEAWVFAMKGIIALFKDVAQSQTVDFTPDINTDSAYLLLPSDPNFDPTKTTDKVSFTWTVSTSSGNIPFHGSINKNGSAVFSNNPSATFTPLATTDSLLDTAQGSQLAQNCADVLNATVSADLFANMFWSNISAERAAWYKLALVTLRDSYANNPTANSLFNLGDPADYMRLLGIVDTTRSTYDSSAFLSFFLGTAVTDSVPLYDGATVPLAGNQYILLGAEVWDEGASGQTAEYLAGTYTRASDRVLGLALYMGLSEWGYRDSFGEGTYSSCSVIDKKPEDLVTQNSLFDNIMINGSVDLCDAMNTGSVEATYASEGNVEFKYTDPTTPANTFTIICDPSSEDAANKCNIEMISASTHNGVSQPLGSTLFLDQGLSTVTRSGNAATFKIVQGYNEPSGLTHHPVTACEFTCTNIPDPPSPEPQNPFVW
ncbi:hypothetical protein K1X76_08050 [bacterium]|nr:hypothetical protein [bacterium]